MLKELSDPDLKEECQQTIYDSDRRLIYLQKQLNKLLKRRSESTGGPLRNLDTESSLLSDVSYVSPSYTNSTPADTLATTPTPKDNHRGLGNRNNATSQSTTSVFGSILNTLGRKSMISNRISKSFSSNDLNNTSETTFDKTFCKCTLYSFSRKIFSFGTEANVLEKVFFFFFTFEICMLTYEHKYPKSIPIDIGWNL